MKKLQKYVLLWVLILAMVLMTACQPEQPGPDQGDFTDLSVRQATGANGVVASASPYASKAGLDVLLKGGNAFDAAVAVAFALGVTEPNASGVGGGGIMVAYNASTGKYLNYNFREFVPAAGTAEAFGTDARLDGGITASGVPTEVAGLLKIKEDLGNSELTLADVMAPAIDYAENGFEIPKELAGIISDNFSSIADAGEEAVAVFSDGIEPLTEGDLLVQKNYAAVLKEIANKGLDGFYSGWVAEAIVNTVAEKGGFITQADLDYAKENYPKISEPLVGTYKDYDVVTANTPSSGGIILVEALNMLEYFQNSTGTSLESLGHNSADYLHTIGTAMQLAYGDKRKYIADTAFVDVPLTGLMNKVYAADRWNECFDPNNAFVMTSSDAYGDPWPYVTEPANIVDYTALDYDEHFSTTTFSVTDSQGNIVTITQTINYFFGNHVVPTGCGFFLNNELSSFSLTQSSVHYVEPYKQPVSHIMPTIIMKEGNPFLTLGSPGSMRIPAAVLQVALNVIEFDMDLQEAIEAARIYSYAVSSSDPDPDKKLIDVETLIGETAIEGLRAKNYFVDTSYGELSNHFGGVQAILFNYDEQGNLVNMTGGADTRRDGKALAY